LFAVRLAGEEMTVTLIVVIIVAVLLSQ